GCRGLAETAWSIASRWMALVSHRLGCACIGSGPVSERKRNRAAYAWRVGRAGALVGGRGADYWLRRRDGGNGRGCRAQLRSSVSLPPVPAGGEEVRTH